MRDWRFSDLRDWLAIHAPLPQLDHTLAADTEEWEAMMQQDLRRRYRWADIALRVRLEGQHLAEAQLPDVRLPAGIEVGQTERRLLRWIQHLPPQERSIRDLTTRMGYRSPRSVHLLIGRLARLQLVERTATGLRLKF